MIDLKELFDDHSLLAESIGSPKHIFEDGDLTFADIRDILTKVFSGEINIEEKVDGVDLMITYKDGKFCVARDVKRLKDPVEYGKVDSKFCGAPKEMKDAITNSLKDLSTALSELDPVQLNKYFANGQNFLYCQIIYPPTMNVIDYGNKCFVVLRGIKCFNEKFKEVGTDKESADQLFGMMQNNGVLQQETFEITKPNILKLKNTTTAKAALQKVLEQLDKFIDGVGWKCSLNQYIQDRYSRHIVNKALEHGIDVSKNSDFVRTLSQRLSQISGMKPTKSDLVTYAKCDGVNTRTDEYKSFIKDLEAGSEETNEDIIRPIENLIIYAGMVLMQNLVGFMSVDPSKTAKKLLASLDDSILGINEGEFQLSPEKIQSFKKNLAKIEKYTETMPAEGVLIKYKGKAYKLTSTFGPIEQIVNLIKYK